jgi:hypothetical protein
MLETNKDLIVLVAKMLCRAYVLGSSNDSITWKLLKLEELLTKE